MSCPFELHQLQAIAQAVLTILKQPKHDASIEHFFSDRYSNMCCSIKG